MSVTILNGDHGDGACRAIERMQAVYGVPASAVRVVRAPYRICPVGAHIDHQYGRVTACAIDHAVYLAFTPSDDSTVRIVSEEFPTPVSFDVRQTVQPEPACWANYARGAAAALNRTATLGTGFKGVTTGGRSRAGLSSSAAVGLAYLLALAHCNDLDCSAEELVRLDEHIETEFLGLKNGILDPAAIVHARAGCLTSIDTRSGAVEQHSPSAPFTFMAFHSGIVEALTPGNFNGRVEESLRAAALLAAHADMTFDQPRLGDIPRPVYDAFRHMLPPTEARRADHFFSEAARVTGAIDAWGHGDESALGQLIRASAQSSIENYECGATPVKDLLTILNSVPGVFGARFCGPGFRGCCVALVERDAREEVADAATARYRALHPALAARSWILDCAPAQGLGFVA